MLLATPTPTPGGPRLHCLTCRNADARGQEEGTAHPSPPQALTGSTRTGESVVVLVVWVLPL